MKFLVLLIMIFISPILLGQQNFFIEKKLDVSGGINFFLRDDEIVIQSIAELSNSDRFDDIAISLNKLNKNADDFRSINIVNVLQRNNKFYIFYNYANNHRAVHISIFDKKGVLLNTRLLYNQYINLVSAESASLLIQDGFQLAIYNIDLNQYVHLAISAIMVVDYFYFSDSQLCILDTNNMIKEFSIQGSSMLVEREFLIKHEIGDIIAFDKIGLKVLFQYSKKNGFYIYDLLSDEVCSFLDEETHKFFYLGQDAKGLIYFYTDLIGVFIINFVAGANSIYSY